MQNKQERHTLYKNDALVVDLFIAASSACNQKEAGLILSALLSRRELVFLARRLRIAVLLTSGYSYTTIYKSMGASSHTIAKVQSWLDSKEENFLLLLKKLGEVGQINKILGEPQFNCQPTTGSHTSNRMTGKYSECFWPVEIIGAIVSGLKDPDDRDK